MGIGIIQQRDAYSLHALKFLTSLLANITVTILFFSNHTAAKSFLNHAQFRQWNNVLTTYNYFMLINTWITAIRLIKINIDNSKTKS